MCSEFSDKERERLRQNWKSNPRNFSFKALVTGESGTGKTHLLRTARLPIHVDSFDPGGTKVLQDLMENGDVFADTEYEEENPYEPTKFNRWKNEFELRLRNNYFDDLGTYCLDSSTRWSMAIMNQQLKSDKKGSRAGQAPQWSVDYVPAKVEAINYINKILALPCDVIVTGHLKDIYENKKTMTGEEQSLVGYRYLAVGDAKVYIPLGFDEIYVTLVEPARGTNKPEYKLLTASMGLYQAKTRIGRGVFDTFEEPNIQKLLKKANWNTK